MEQEYIEVIDFIKYTNLDLDTVQRLIKHHSVNYIIDDDITYIHESEVNYFRNYYATHKYPIHQN